jgi:YQGE family putative transporter
LISLGVFVADAAVTFFLRTRPAAGTKYEWLLTPRVLSAPRSPWRPIFGALAAQGIRESVFGIMIGLLVYIRTGSEMQLGNYTLITSLVGFFSYYAAGKRLKPRRRRAGMLLGAIAMAAVIVPLLGGIRYSALLVFGIGTALFQPLFIIPITTTVFDWIGRNEQSAKQRVEYIVMRELALNAGRIAGMAILIATLAASRAPHVIVWAMLAIGCSPICSWFLMRKRLML